MHIQILKSKIHQARITACDLFYEGSLAVDLDILDKAGILPYEKILVVNASNGERLETYAIPAPRGSRTILLNGAAARKGTPGDIVTVMAFASVTPQEAATLRPRKVVLDADNNVVKESAGSGA